MNLSFPLTSIFFRGVYHQPVFIPNAKLQPATMEASRALRALRSPSWRSETHSIPSRRARTGAPVKKKYGSWVELSTLGNWKKSGKKHGNMFKHPFERKHERNLLLTICRIVGGQRWTRPRKRALRLATPGVKWRKSERLHWTRSLRLPGTRKSFGSSIPKTGSFQYKPTILGYPHSRNTPYDYYDMFNYIYIYRYNISVVYGRL